MSNQEILTKAIQKAIDGGWDVEFIAKDCYRKWYKRPYISPDGVAGTELGCTDYQFDSEHPNNPIFNHDFAKALWGEGTYRRINSFIRESVNKDFGWQHHLQNMVIADDPIKYLGENI